LRAGIGQSRVFNKSKYEEIFDVEALEDQEKLYRLSIELLISTLILDTTRDQINDKSSVLISRLPIIKKSAYYLAGYIYARNIGFFDSKEEELLKLLVEDNPFKLKHTTIPSDITSKVNEAFDTDIDGFIQFYNGANIAKEDIDNLLKISKMLLKKYIVIVNKFL